MITTALKIRIAALSLSVTSIFCYFGNNLYAGGKDGGGGGVIVEGAKVRFVDLFLLDPDFQDRESFEFKGSEYTADNSKLVSHTSAMALAKALSHEWQNQSGLARFAHPGLGIDGLNRIKNAIIGSLYIDQATMGLVSENLQWFFTEQSIDAPISAYYLPPALSNKREFFKLVAYYNFRQRPKRPAEFKISIDRTYWDQMGILSRTATIIHESLRHYQMPSLMTSGRVYFGERALQQATAIIVGCRPEPALAYAMALILNGKSEASDTEFAELIQRYCKRLW